MCKPKTQEKGHNLRSFVSFVITLRKNSRQHKSAKSVHKKTSELRTIIWCLLSSVWRSGNLLEARSRAVSWEDSWGRLPASWQVDSHISIHFPVSNPVFDFRIRIKTNIIFIHKKNLLHFSIQICINKIEFKQTVHKRRRFMYLLFLLSVHLRCL